MPIAVLSSFFFFFCLLLCICSCLWPFCFHSHERHFDFSFFKTQMHCSKYSYVTLAKKQTGTCVYRLLIIKKWLHLQGKTRVFISPAFTWPSQAREQEERGRNPSGLVSLLVAAETRILILRVKNTDSRYGQRGRVLYWPWGQVQRRASPSEVLAFQSQPPILFHFSNWVSLWGWNIPQPVLYSPLFTFSVERSACLSLSVFLSQ